MLRFVIGLLAVLSLAGCEKLSGEAVVLAKEHIDARPIAETPAAGQPASSKEPVVAATGEEQPVALRGDEIMVDGCIIKAEDRGTSRDPRAMNDEQWIVKVRVINNRRQFNVLASRLQFDKLKEGDRVQVAYRVGKYTGTVWASEIK